MSESELLDQFRTEASRQEQISDSASVPIGWQPYSEYSDQIGEAIVRLPTPGATEKDLLVSAGFDPSAWKIAGAVNTRRWMRSDQEWLYYYKFDVISGESDEIIEEHIDELVERIRKKSPAPKAALVSDDAFLVALADFQIGKSYAGSGTSDTVTRVKEGIDLAVLRLKELRAQGKTVQHGIIAGLGDLVEGCSGHYESQRFIIDKNQRDQNRITRELVYYAIDAFYPLFDKLTVLTVGGNHGENRKNGKIMTDDADNADVAAFEAVKEAYDRAGIKDIEWIIPQNELSVSVPVGDLSVGFTHGHLFRQGASAAIKAMNWWKGQVFGYQPVQDCKILISGHFHHYSLVTAGIRTHIQVPAMDCGSAWFSNSTGEESPPGMFTVRITRENDFGWDDAKVIWV